MLTPEEQKARELAQALKITRWTYDPSSANVEHEESEIYDDNGRRVFGLHSYTYPVARYLGYVDPAFTLSVLTRLEEALAENEHLKDRVVELERELEAID